MRAAWQRLAAGSNALTERLTAFGTHAVPRASAAERRLALHEVLAAVATALVAGVRHSARMPASRPLASAKLLALFGERGGIGRAGSAHAVAAREVEVDHHDASATVLVARLGAGVRAAGADALAWLCALSCGVVVRVTYARACVRAAAHRRAAQGLAVEVVGIDATLAAHAMAAARP